MRKWHFCLAESMLFQSLRQNFSASYFCDSKATLLLRNWQPARLAYSLISGIGFLYNPFYSLWQFKFLISWHCRGFGFKCRKLEIFHFSQHNPHSNIVRHSLILSSCVAILSFLLFFFFFQSFSSMGCSLWEMMVFDLQQWKSQPAPGWGGAHSSLPWAESVGLGLDCDEAEQWPSELQLLL